MPRITSIQLNTVEELNEYFSGYFEFDYNYGCEIKFYTNKKILYKSVYSNLYLPNVFLSERFYPTIQNKVDRFLSLFNTPNQYYSGLHYFVRDFNDQFKYEKNKPILSFAEVFHKDVFISRHFIRSLIICPQVSFEHDREKCPFIKNKLIATKTTIDWKKLQSDSMFKRQDRNISLKEFLEKYKKE